MTRNELVTRGACLLGGLATPTVGFFIDDNRLTPVSEAGHIEPAARSAHSGRCAGPVGVSIDR